MRPNPQTPFPKEKGGSSSLRAGTVIVAAGQGARMGGVDKVFLPLLGRPLIAHTIAAFEAVPQVEAIVLVLSAANVEQGQALVQAHRFAKVRAVCVGGPQRQDSVWCGLQRLPPVPWVAVHDGARPCVTPGLIARGLEEAARHGSAVAAVPVQDTVKRVAGDGTVLETPSRDGLWAVQTPQVFPWDALFHAYRLRETTVTDDASLVERAGYSVHVYMGSYANVKVTTPEDVTIAEAILKGMRTTAEST